jgi:hypothetical protein
MPWDRSSWAVESKRTHLVSCLSTWNILRAPGSEVHRLLILFHYVVGNAKGKKNCKGMGFRSWPLQGLALPQPSRMLCGYPNTQSSNALYRLPESKIQAIVHPPGAVEWGTCVIQSLRRIKARREGRKQRTLDTVFALIVGWEPSMESTL